MPDAIDASLLYMPPTQSARYLPEGPVALGNGKFLWIAIQHGPNAKSGSLNIFDLSTGQNVQIDLHGRPGFARPTAIEGQFVVGCERELGIFRLADRSWTGLADGIDDDVDGTIINDGICFGDNLVFGTKDLEFRSPKAGLYLFRGSDRKTIRMRADQICSNGKAVVSRDDKLFLLDIDSPTRRLVSYEFEPASGTISDCQTLVDMTDLAAVPDGMTLTPDKQSAIISFYNPNPAKFGETRQYSLRSGDLESLWRTPYSPQATCPLLIDHPDGSVKLVITTAVENMPGDRRDASANAGGIFIADTNFQQAPEVNRFLFEV